MSEYPANSWLRGNHRPAPPEIWVYHLAVFRRAFRVIAQYADEDYHAGMLLGGHFADALHNVPSLLWSFRAIKYGNYSPEPIKRFLLQHASTFSRRPAVCKRLAQDISDIYQREGAANELSLSDDLSDLQMPLKIVQHHYLDMLYATCVITRLQVSFLVSAHFAEKSCLLFASR